MFRTKDTKGTKKSIGNVRVLCVLGVLCANCLFLFSSRVWADEITGALEASAQAQRAARESQQRVDKLDDEMRGLREKRQALSWRSLQQSAYATQLEQQAQTEELKRAELEAQIARIKVTETELLPLMRRMVTELEAFVTGDLPFLRETRQQRVQELKVLLDDPARGVAEKFRRVLETHRTEVDYGYSLSAEETEIEHGGRRETVSLVRVGRVGLYFLSADQTRGGYWNSDKQGWRPLDDDVLPDLQRALKVARGELPPELLVLPVQVAR